MLSPILSAFAFLLAAGALVIPLPLGIASIIMGMLAAMASGAQPWARRFALLAVVAGFLGIAGGFWIGAAITQP